MYNKQPIKLTITNQDKDLYRKLYVDYLCQQIHDKLESISSEVCGKNGNQKAVHIVREIL